MGGTGDDTYVIDNIGDVVTELSNGGTDTVVSSLSYLLDPNVEDRVLTGTARKGTGNELNNVINGNAAVNLLSGAGGDDTLRGFDGIDRLTGGTGADRFVMDVNSTRVKTTRGNVPIDLVMDFSSADGDKIDPSNIDFNDGAPDNGTYTFVGQSGGQNADDVGPSTYDSVSAAEGALGYDIQGVDGPRCRRTGLDHLRPHRRRRQRGLRDRAVQHPHGQLADNDLSRSRSRQHGRQISLALRRAQRSRRRDAPTPRRAVARASCSGCAGTWNCCTSVQATMRPAGKYAPVDCDFSACRQQCGGPEDVRKEKVQCVTSTI